MRANTEQFANQLQDVMQAQKLPYSSPLIMVFTTKTIETGTTPNTPESFGGFDLTSP